MEETTENFPQVETETKTELPTSASRTGKKIKRPTEKVTKIKNPGRVDAGKNLALWNKLQKERLLRSSSSKEHTEQKEETKKTKHTQHFQCVLCFTHK